MIRVESHGKLTAERHKVLVDREVKVVNLIRTHMFTACRLGLYS